MTGVYRQPLPPLIRQGGISRFAVENPDASDIFSQGERAFCLGQLRGPAAANFSAVGVQNGILQSADQIVVLERVFIFSVAAGNGVNLQVGSNFAGIANLTGGGPKGSRDGRLNATGVIGDELLSFRDDGALATPTPANLIASIATGVGTAGYALPWPLGPFYLRPGQFLAIVGDVVNKAVAWYVEGHISAYAHKL